MRTYYEIEESDAYLAARDLLLRRVEAWAGANGLVMSRPLAGNNRGAGYAPAGGSGIARPRQAGPAGQEAPVSHAAVDSVVLFWFVVALTVLSLVLIGVTV